MPLQEFHTCGTAKAKTHCQPWVQKLLLGAPGLKALSTTASTLPCAPVIQHLALRHLELDVTDMTTEQLESYLIDISCCLTLESLAILEIDMMVAINASKHALYGFKVLPSMHLHSMPRLKHVRLVNCLEVQALTLPADCALFLDGCCYDKFSWRAQCQKFQGCTNVLRLGTLLTEWPTGIQGFSNLEYLELLVEDLYSGDLADLQHIPHVRLISQNQVGGFMCYNAELHLTSGSWQSLEVFSHGDLNLSIKEIDSFVRETKRFTFSSHNTRGATDPLFQEILCACQRQGKACHVIPHKAILSRKEVTYTTISTSKEVAEKFPIIYDDDHKKGPAIMAGPFLIYDRTLGGENPVLS